jgi:hypothetical protein
LTCQVSGSLKIIYFAHFTADLVSLNKRRGFTTLLKFIKKFPVILAIIKIRVIPQDLDFFWIDTAYKNKKMDETDVINSCFSSSSI